MKKVLTIDNAATVENRARLHRADCSALNRYRGRGMNPRRVHTEDVEELVAELEELGFPVRECACCGKRGVS